VGKVKPTMNVLRWVRGLQHMFLLGYMGIDCNLRILEERDMSPNVRTGLSLEEQYCIVHSLFTTIMMIFVVS
jgi:hypothetical protein